MDTLSTQPITMPGQQTAPREDTAADSGPPPAPWLERGPLRRMLRRVTVWFDSSRGESTAPNDMQVDYWRSIPYIAVHLMCLGVIWVGWSPVAVGVAVVLYFARMFAITGFYHRYFSHRSFKTSRFWQFVFALAGFLETGSLLMLVVVTGVLSLAMVSAAFYLALNLWKVLRS